MGNIRSITNSNLVKSMIGKGSSTTGEGAGCLLAEELAAEMAKPATTPEERAWRRFTDPERRKQIREGARKAALIVARCTP